MAEVTLAALAELGVELPPTEDELPYDDGMPMESQRHVMQLQLLMDPLRLLWEGRQDVYINTPPVLHGFSWERHAPAWLLEPGWSPALPGEDTGAGLTKWTLVLCQYEYDCKFCSLSQE